MTKKEKQKKRTQKLVKIEQNAKKIRRKIKMAIKV